MWTTTHSRCVRWAWRSTGPDTSPACVRGTSELRSLMNTFRKLFTSTSPTTTSNGCTMPMKDTIQVWLDSDIICVIWEYFYELWDFLLICVLLLALFELYHSTDSFLKLLWVTLGRKKMKFWKLLKHHFCICISVSDALLCHPQDTSMLSAVR